VDASESGLWRIGHCGPGQVQAGTTFRANAVTCLVDSIRWMGCPVPTMRRGRDGAIATSLGYGGYNMTGAAVLCHDGGQAGSGTLLHT